jgi:hypothetical protein
MNFFRYDASERISAREAMRHPYFKEAREADAKKTAEGAQGVSEEASVASGGLDSTRNKKATTNGGSQKINAVLNKGLPSIGGGGGSEVGSDITPVQKQASSNSMHQYATANHKHGASKHQGSHLTGAQTGTLPLFNGSIQQQGSGVHNSSLPPIAGGSVGAKHDKLTQSQLAQQPKKRKKYKTQELSKGTKRTGQEQVLRTYGLAGKTMSTDSRSEVKIDGKPAGGGSYNHPVSMCIQFGNDVQAV